MACLHRSLLSAVIAFCLLTVGPLAALAQQTTSLRPPAVPLVTHDPYFSVWSMSDKLTDETSKHWTGANHGMAGMARIDGKAYRFLGQWRGGAGAPPAMTQVRREVTPTRTIYEFDAEGVRLALTFMSPLLPGDLDVMSRPVTYLTWDVRATDNQSHKVTLYFDCTAEWAVNTPHDKVVWARHKLGDMQILRVGSQEQPVLEKSGDDLRIDWGYLYLVNPQRSAADGEVIASQRTARRSFAELGSLPDSDDLRMPRAARIEMPVLASMMDFGNVGPTPVSRHLMIAYDDQFSVEYFHRRLRPYWRRGGMEADALLKAAAREYPSLVERCKAFDAELMTDLRRVGGEEYAQLAALTFRQTVAAHKLAADFDGSPVFFSKENFSNGSIDTVDVTYPSSPFFLLFNPELLKAQITPIMDYVDPRVGRGRMRRMTSALTRSLMVRHTAAEKNPKRIRCPLKNAAICC